MSCICQTIDYDESKYRVYCLGFTTYHRPAKSHGISVSLQKWGMISRSHGNVTKSHGI